MLVMGGERIRISEHTYSPKVDMIIPTYKPEKKFSKPLRMLGLQTYPVGRIMVTNTEKAYWSSKGHQRIPNMEVHHLSKTEFDHEATKNRDARYNRTNIIVFMTDDVVSADEYLIGCFVDTFKQRGSQGGSVIMAYAHRLPDKGCSMARRYTRSFNYPEGSCIKTKEDLECMGIKAFFAPGACYAYNHEKFRFQSEFITKAIFNEDIVFVGRTVLQDDYAIAYVAEARVIHSHSCGYAAQFQRNFDLAISQTDHPEVFAGIRSESEGVRPMKQTAGHLAKIHRPWLMPGMIVKSGFKYMEYRVGKYYHMLPRSLAIKCSMDKEYWK